jgi:tripartite-type tricarboxylate transporter receptor subunit TctC
MVRKITSAPTRRQAIATLGAAALAPFAAAVPALAQQQWPKGRNLKMVVPFPPGGATDVIARILADKLAQIWGTAVIIENKGGAGGNIGMEQVARSEPNGDTMMMGTFGLAINPALYKSLKFDPIADFAPISLVTIMPNMLACPVSAPFNSVAELIAYGKANPGKLTYASSGIGTSIHLCGELFKKLTGVQMVHAPYRGSAQAVQDLVAGRVDLMFDNITSSLPQVQGKTLKALAVTTPKRSPFVPDLPPVADTVPGFEVSAWFGTLAPAKTPPEIVEKISRDTKLALQDPGVKGKLDALAAESVGSTPQEFAALIKSETDKWGKLIREEKITAE